MDITYETHSSFPIFSPVELTWVPEPQNLNETKGTQGTVEHPFLLFPPQSIRLKTLENFP